MSQDFSKGKIYKITNDYNDDIYIGSTCNTLIKRFSQHKADHIREKNKDYPLYSLMNEIGFERFRIELIEDFVCSDKYELRQKEGFYIRQMGTLNKKIAGRTKQEYDKQYKKQYNEVHKEEIQERTKEYNDKYWEKNKEKLLEIKSEKIKCECGLFCTRSHLQRHKRTEKHNELMKNLSMS